MLFMFLQKCKIKRGYSSLRTIRYLYISQIYNTINLRSQQLSRTRASLTIRNCGYQGTPATGTMAHKADLRALQRPPRWQIPL